MHFGTIVYYIGLLLHVYYQVKDVIGGTFINETEPTTAIQQRYLE